jgi:hypothetical protein
MAVPQVTPPDRRAAPGNERAKSRAFDPPHPEFIVLALVAGLGWFAIAWRQWGLDTKQLLGGTAVAAACLLLVAILRMIWSSAHRLIAATLVR